MALDLSSALRAVIDGGPYDQDCGYASWNNADPHHSAPGWTMLEEVESRIPWPEASKKTNQHIMAFWAG
ncbi:hypothetical protein [Nocardia sp. NPDC127526]|uniref:hypothetical protein n=1 Tax=Nocardia sp. NPDC127526 TaxID=3345393 RepID=UPI0036447EF5